MAFQKRRHQYGFSLIELMVVVAILGVVSALALPAYQDYLARAQASEGLKLASGVQNDIGVYLWTHDAYPHAAVVSNSGELGSAISQLQGKYVAANGVAVTPDTGVITVAFSAGANAGKSLTLTPHQSGHTQVIRWSCAGTLAPSRLPSTCQE